MKKALAIIMAIGIMASLAACGSSAGTTSAGSAVAGSTASASTEKTQYKSDAKFDAKTLKLANSAAGKTYTVGTDTTFAPFEFENDKGDFTGIDIQLMNAAADMMGFKVDWKVLGFSAAVTALEASQVDAVIAGMSITDERKAKYDFSESYYDCAVAVAVANDSKYKSLDDLKGQTVACKTGTTGSQYAEKLEKKYNLKLKYVDESSVMYQYVTSGQAAACFEDYPIIQYEISRGSIKCKVINQSDYSYPTGVAVMKGKNSELIAAFNVAFERMKEDGSYDKILNTYFSK